VVEHLPQYPKVEGLSTPTADTEIKNGKKYESRNEPTAIAQLVEQSTKDPKFKGLIPATTGNCVKSMR
jgi:hypothetical protein